MNHIFLFEIFKRILKERERQPRSQGFFPLRVGLSGVKRPGNEVVRDCSRMYTKVNYSLQSSQVENQT